MCFNSLRISSGNGNLRTLRVCLHSFKPANSSLPLALNMFSDTWNSWHDHANDMSLSELIGITFSGLIGISRLRRRSVTQENRSYQLGTCARECREFSSQPTGAGNKSMRCRKGSSVRQEVAPMPNSAQKVRPNNSQNDTRKDSARSTFSLRSVIVIRVLRKAL